MILHINDLLNRWAMWSTRRASSGLGYPRQAIYTRLVGNTQVALMPEIDEESWAVEQAVQSLKHHRNLYEVVLEMYLKGGTSEQKAKALHCHRDTMYARLHQAQIKVMTWLSENA
jgi:DNA-directed RNA polymerase specialized sigma24 family protein